MTTDEVRRIANFVEHSYGGTPHQLARAALAMADVVDAARICRDDIRKEWPAPPDSDLVDAVTFALVAFDAAKAEV